MQVQGQRATCKMPMPRPRNRARANRLSQYNCDLMTEPSQDHSSRALRRVFGLDALRAAAILSVVFSHLFVVLYPHLGQGLMFFGNAGFYGVELFFVLSGFLIGQILLRTGPEIGNPRNLLLFYVRRWFRTLPLFILFLWVNVWIKYWFDNYTFKDWEILQHGLFLRTFTTNRMTFFAESWSLAIEEWFYLLFPATLAIGVFIFRKFDRAFLFSAAAFYLFSTVSRVFTAQIPHYTWDNWQRWIVIDRFDALMIGMFAAWIAGRSPKLWARHARWLALVGGVMLIVIYFSLWRIHNGRLAFAPDSFFARTFRFNLVSLGCALLLPAASLWTREHESAGSLFVRKIALWSYAMYLVHLPIFSVTSHYIFTGWKDSMWQGLVLFGLQLGSTIVVSGLLYRFFETRFTRLREPVGKWLLAA